MPSLDAPERRAPAPPQQARSRARVDRILEVADRLLVDEGVEALTIRRLAQAADVPTGTIYRFFADKQHVLDVLADRYLTTFREAMASVADSAPLPAPDDVVGFLLDLFVELNREQPGYRLLWTGGHLSPELRDADAENDVELAAALHALLRRMGVAGADDATVAAACRVAVLAVSAVFRLAFRVDPDGDPMLLAQLRLLLTSYVDALELR